MSAGIRYGACAVAAALVLLAGCSGSGSPDDINGPDAPGAPETPDAPASNAETRPEVHPSTDLPDVGADACVQVQGPVLEFRWETDWPDADPGDDRRTASVGAAKVTFHGDAPESGSATAGHLATFADTEGRPFRLYYALPDDRMLPLAVGDDVRIDAVTIFTWWVDRRIVIRSAADPDAIVFFGQDACVGGVSDTKPDDWNACTGTGACPSVAFAGDACPVEVMQYGTGVHEDVVFRLDGTPAQEVPWHAVVEDASGRTWVNAYNYRITKRGNVADAPFTWLLAGMVGAP